MMDPLLRTTVGKRYVVQRGPLGETGEADAGGWSDVYLAVDRRMHDRRVVLKFPKRALLAGEDGAQFRARFRREVAMPLARSEHCPGVVPILDAGARRSVLPTRRPGRLPS
jgi:serine/threonine protein kinase